MVKIFVILIGWLVSPSICFGQGRFSGGPGRGDASVVVQMQSAGGALAYPNPAKCGQVVQLSGNATTFDVLSINGYILITNTATYLANSPGIYILKTSDKWLKLVVY